MELESSNPTLGTFVRAQNGCTKMNTVNENSCPQIVVTRLPLWLRVSGVVLSIGTAMLTARIIWEETVWTWERGPQMVGFSLAHGLGGILLMFPFVLVLWAIVVVILTIRSRLRNNRIARTRWVGLSLVVLLFVILALPDGFWEKAFISRMAASPGSGDLLMTAAAQGDFSTVNAFVSHGVPVDATDHFYKMTALHAAAAKGDLKIINFLVSQGANVNVLDRDGDSPLELAATNGHNDAANFLSNRGAKRVRGDEAQRKRAIQEEVDESTKSLEN
jgi:hypothetical protein